MLLETFGDCLPVHSTGLLGKVSVAVHEDEGSHWQRHKLPLVGASGSARSEIEFEMQLLPEGTQADVKRSARGGSQDEEELEYQLGTRMFQPKAHALPWQGVRVLEFARRTWTAALCGQMMAACGAEVTWSF